jgi:hypothetical protein
MDNDERLFNLMKLYKEYKKDLTKYTEKTTSNDVFKYDHQITFCRGRCNATRQIMVECFGFKTNDKRF